MGEDNVSRVPELKKFEDINDYKNITSTMAMRDTRLQYPAHPVTSMLARI